MPFGEAMVTVSKIENPIRFSGQYYDGETGTRYNYYRNYDPSLGRYIQSDPIGLEDGLVRY
jgi:RHS repeat-associated protein